MLNRRQVLHSLFSIAAGSACAQAARACNTVAVMHAPTSDSSVTQLAELLLEAIEFCGNSSSHRAVFERTPGYQCVRTRQLCEIALNRLRKSPSQSPSQSPAFWQACADSVERLEAAIRTSSQTVSDTRSDVARTLWRLRHCLTDQTAIALEARTLQA